MKERPILFSGPMVRAILDGRKTMTRRVINWRSDRADEVHDGEGQGNSLFEMRDGGWWPYYVYDNIEIPLECPYKADRLWVRETWKPTRSAINDNTYVRYRADDSRLEVEHSLAGSQNDRWRPSIHMYRWASRLELEVTDVRVERLQDISEDDATAEGVDAVSLADVPRQATWSRRQDFAHLWDSLNKKRDYGWDTNPWVWVVAFVQTGQT